MLIVSAIASAFSFLVKILEFFIMIFPDILALIRAWKGYYADIAKRQADAVKTQIDQQIKAESVQARKELANQRAFIMGLDKAWEVRYTQILACLNEGRDADVLLMAEVVDYPPIDEILFHSEEANEYKARKICAIMRNKI